MDLSESGFGGWEMLRIRAGGGRAEICSPCGLLVLCFYSMFFLLLSGATCFLPSLSNFKLFVSGMYSAHQFSKLERHL